MTMITKEELLYNLKNEIIRKNKGSASYQTDDLFWPFWLRKIVGIHRFLKRYKIYRIFDSKAYPYIEKYLSRGLTITYLLSLQDEIFLKTVYKLFLDREPDRDGLDWWLNRLRSGEIVKLNIIFAIRFSKEGKEKGVYVKGLYINYLMCKIYKLPLIGNIIKILVCLSRLPSISHKVDKLESQMEAMKFNFSKVDLLKNKDKNGK